MKNVKAVGLSVQSKVELVRRTRARNYSASLSLEGFSVSSSRVSEPVTASHKEELIDKYKRLAY